MKRNVSSKLPFLPHHLSKYAICNVRAYAMGLYRLVQNSSTGTVFMGEGRLGEGIGYRTSLRFHQPISGPRRLINYCWPLKSSRITVRKWFISASRPEDGRNNNKIIISVATGTRLLSNTQLSPPQTVPPSLQFQFRQPS